MCLPCLFLPCHANLKYKDGLWHASWTRRTKRQVSQTALCAVQSTSSRCASEWLMSWKDSNFLVLLSFPAYSPSFKRLLLWEWKDSKRRELQFHLEEVCKSFPTMSPVPWEVLRSCLIFNRLPKAQPSQPTCGKILAHAKRKVDAFRERIGISVAVFKLGVTAHPAQRFQTYLSKNFEEMWIIYMSDDVALTHMLEAALIALFSHASGCRNEVGTGGEGALNRKVHAGLPYFNYVAGGRADQLKRVG